MADDKKASEPSTSAAPAASALSPRVAPATPVASNQPTNVKASDRVGQTGAAGRQVLSTKDYRVRQGKQHRHLGQIKTGGEIVPLTESQARAFRDKFEPVDGPVNPSPEQQRRDDLIAKTDAKVNAPKPTTPIAEDIGGKTPVGEKAPNVTTDPEVRDRAAREGR